MSIALAIPVWNRVEFTKECLETFTQYTNFDLVTKVIIYDNNSGKEMEELITSFDHDYLTNSYNTAWAGFNDLLDKVLEDESIDYIGKVDNDASFTQKWIEPIMTEFESRDKCGSIRYGFSGSNGSTSKLLVNGGYHGGLKIFRKSCARKVLKKGRFSGSEATSSFIRKRGMTTDSMEVGVSMLTEKYPELSKKYTSLKWQRK